MRSILLKISKYKYTNVRGGGGGGSVSLLTDGCDDRGGEKQSSGELPLRAKAIRHKPDDVGSDPLVIRCSDVVAHLESLCFVLQQTALGDLVLRLQRIEHCCPDQQVSKRTDDQLLSNPVPSLPCHAPVDMFSQLRGNIVHVQMIRASVRTFCRFIAHLLHKRQRCTRAARGHIMSALRHFVGVRTGVTPSPNSNFNPGPVDPAIGYLRSHYVLAEA